MTTDIEVIFEMPLSIVFCPWYNRDMIKLRLAQLATQRGLNLNQTAIQSGISLAVIRRYWYSSKDGKKDGEPLLEVRMDFLEKLADLLKVDDLGKFFERTGDDG